MKNIRVLIADDHPIVREGLRLLIASESGMELAGEAVNGNELIVKARDLKPDVILTDLVMPEKDGLQAIREIRKDSPVTKIIVLTSFAEDERILAALKAGATGYLLKDSLPEELLAAIQDVYAGKPSLSSPVASKLLHTPAPAASEAPPAGESTPKVGGELVWALPAEPDTLDWHMAWSLYSYYVDSYISASLLYLDADKNIIPYLAESYTVSDDGLVYEFKLRTDVKFHDGTPLTAQDYAWTLNRAIDPETASPVAGTMFGPVDKIEAVDDSTLRITLTERFAPLLFNLSDPGYTGPMSKAAFEKMGAEEFARAPVGVGPYKVKEWITGERIVLERNPDYNWGSAAYKNRGAYYIETLTFRPIMESATLLAGLQAGEIQFAQLERKDVANFQNSSDFTLFSQPFKGANGLLFNVSKPPFDDMRVRKAFNLAVDRQAIIDVVLFGMGEIQYGPLSKPQIGYWEGKDVGYNYDLEAAKALMLEAGYTYNANGMLEKDGKPFSLTLLSSSAGADTQSKMAQVAQQQLKAFGVDVTIEQLEDGVLWEKIMSGDYELSVLGYTGPEADLLYLIYHSTGGLNMSHVSDPELDALLAESRTAPDSASRQAKLDALQKLIVEKAYILPIFVPTDYYALDSRIAGSNMIFFDVLNLADAYYK